jgi:hypothetical protein
MIAPEQWYEHQLNYQRYGFDMKPQPEERRQRGTRKKPQPKKVIPFKNERKAAFYVVLAAGIAMIMLIIITAYSANLRYDINKTIKENNVIIGEIENLEAKVYAANNIDYIEGQAKSKLKMRSTSEKTRVYIASDDMPQEGFADMLKEKAYN